MMLSAASMVLHDLSGTGCGSEPFQMGPVTECVLAANLALRLNQ